MILAVCRLFTITAVSSQLLPSLHNYCHLSLKLHTELHIAVCHHTCTSEGVLSTTLGTEPTTTVTCTSGGEQLVVTGEFVECPSDISTFCPIVGSPAPTAHPSFSNPSPPGDDPGPSPVPVPTPAPTGYTVSDPFSALLRLHVSFASFV